MRSPVIGVAFGVALSACAPEGAAPPPKTAPSFRLPPRHDVAAKPSVPTPPVTAPSDEEQFNSTLLAQDEVGKDMQKVEDRGVGATADFTAAEGQRARYVRWVDPGAREVVRRISETRWLFPTVARAQQFFSSRLANFEKKDMPKVTDAPSVGDESRVYADIQASPGPVQDSYTFVFRTGRVVAEVTVSRGEKAPEGSLTSAKAVEFANVATQRIEKAYPPAPTKQ